MTPAPTFRKYDASDLPGLREIFFSNVPPYFDHSEWLPFENFLVNDIGTRWQYEVMLVDGRLVGVGGIGMKNDGTLNLAWGMVGRQWHRQGLGVRLLERRLQMAEELFPGIPLSVTTSQHTSGFFEKYGFITTETQPEFWGPGLHLHRMIRYSDPASALRFRAYDPADREALHRVFLSNTPTYFREEEWSDLRDFLHNDLNATCDYEVVLLGGWVAGAGGIALNDDGTVSLCWGMLDSGIHKKGFGKALLMRRLERAAQRFPNAAVVLSTTQHTFAFFERYGFATVATEENFWADGLHLVKMIKS